MLRLWRGTKELAAGAVPSPFEQQPSSDTTAPVANVIPPLEELGVDQDVLESSALNKAAAMSVAWLERAYPTEGDAMARRRVGG